MVDRLKLLLIVVALLAVGLFVLLCWSLLSGCAKYEPPLFDTPKVSNGVIMHIEYYPNRLLCTMRDGRMVMLAGIGTPNPQTPYRKMSIDLFTKLAVGEVAKIEYGEKQVYPDFISAYLYIGNMFVNAEMVRRGYAKYAPTEGNSKYNFQFASLETEAKKAKRGIWAFSEDW